MTFARRSLVFALASLALVACEGASGSDDDGGAAADVCPETGNPLLPEVARVQPRYSIGCDSSTWAGEVERPSVAWTIELERSSDSVTLAPTSDGVVAVAGRDARWISAEGLPIVQRDVGNNLGWNLLQGDFDGRIAVAGSNRYRVFDMSGTEIWLRVLTSNGFPSIVRDGGDLLVGFNDFSQDTTEFRIERWALTGARVGEVSLPVWGVGFARDGAGNWALLQDWTLLIFDPEGTPLGGVELGQGDYPTITQFIAADAGFFVVGGDSDPFVARVVIEGDVPSVAWTHHYGTAGDTWDIAYGVARLPDGGVVIVGSEGTIRTRYPDSPLADWVQPFVLALDEQGDPMWGERIGAVGIAYAVTVGAAGEVYVAGSAQAGAPNEYGQTSWITWLRRYDP